MLLIGKYKRRKRISFQKLNVTRELFMIQFYEWKKLLLQGLFLCSLNQVGTSGYYLNLL